MAEITDDPVASWNERIGTLRKRGRVSAAALSVVSTSGNPDVSRDRPPAPPRLSATERVLWEKLTFSRRPGWFSGAEEMLESYIVTTVQVQQLEGQLRKLKPGTGERYQTLARMHREAVAIGVRLATKLRLTPHSKVDKNQPTDGDLPLS